MQPLRRLAVIVDKNHEHDFTWRIIESTGDAIVFDSEAAASKIPFGTYSAALQAGTDVLKLYGDGEGPITFEEDENADPVNDADAA